VALGLVLWRGGIDRGPQLLIAALILLAAAIIRPRPEMRDPVLVALVVMAVANVGAALVAGRADTVAPALVALALPLAYAIVIGLPQAERVRLLAAIAAVAAAAAAAGVTALVLGQTPYAERIDGIWRAGGTPEYPPALAVLCVCGLAAGLALVTTGEIGTTLAFVLGAILVAGLVLSYDRAGIVMGAVVLALFVRRAARVRRMLPALAVGLVIALAVVVAHPPALHAVRAELTHAPLGARSNVWSDGWRGFRRRPVEGYGPGGFVRIYDTGFDATQTSLAHDLPLEQAVEAGALAAAAAVVLVVCGLWRTLRGLGARDPVRLAFACIGAAMLVSGLYDFTWSYPPLALLGLVGIAGAAAVPDQRSA
jgi:O-antigen ligase